MAGNNRGEIGHPSGFRRAIRRVQAYGSLNTSLVSQTSGLVLATLPTAEHSLGTARSSPFSACSGHRVQTTNPDLNLASAPGCSTSTQLVGDNWPLESVTTSKEGLDIYLASQHPKYDDVRQDNTDDSRNSLSTKRSAQQNRLTKAPRQSSENHKRLLQGRKLDCKPFNISEPYDIVHLDTHSSSDVVVSGRVNPDIHICRLDRILNRHSFAILESPRSWEQRSHSHLPPLSELSDPISSNGGDLVRRHDRSYARPSHPLRSNPVLPVMGLDVMVSEPKIQQQPTVSLSVVNPDITISSPKDPRRSNPATGLLNPDSNIIQPQPHVHQRRLRPKDTWQISYNLEHRKLVKMEERLTASELNIFQETARADQLAEQLANAEAEKARAQDALKRKTQQLQYQVQELLAKRQAEAEALRDLELKLNDLEQRLANQVFQVKDLRQSYKDELARNKDLQCRQATLIEHLKQSSGNQKILALGNHRPRLSTETNLPELADRTLLVSPVEQVAELGYDNLRNIPELSNGVSLVPPIVEHSGFQVPCRVNSQDLESSSTITPNADELHDEFTSLRNYESFWSWDVLDNDPKMLFARSSDLVEIVINKNHHCSLITTHEAVELASSCVHQERSSPQSLQRASSLPRTLRAGTASHDIGAQWRVKKPQDQQPLHDTPPSSPPLSVTASPIIDELKFAGIAAVSSTYLLGVDCDNGRSRDIVFQFENPRIEGVPAVYRNRFSSAVLTGLIKPAEWEINLERLGRFDPWSSIPDLTLLDPRMKRNE